MARRSKTGTSENTDDDRAWPHPRETVRLFGHDEPLAALCADADAGTLHHGILLSGPGGIGKATLAYGLARHLLTGGEGAGDPGNPVVRQIANRASPDLLVLDGEYSGTLTRTIPVEEVRNLVNFFGLTASKDGGYRIGIIDRADDLNRSAANALLKLLEEPPQRGILMLVCEVPDRLPATVRSRCRHIRLSPLDSNALQQAVANTGGQMPGDVPPVVQNWISGSVARALTISDTGFADTLTAAAHHLDALPDMDHGKMEQLIRKVGPREARALFDAIFELIGLHMAAEARGGRHNSALLAEAWPEIMKLKRDADIYNLDRERTLLAAFGRLALAFGAQR